MAGAITKYVNPITPLAVNKFSIRGEEAYSQLAWGYPGWTSFSGELIRLKDGHNVSYGVALYTTSPVLQPPPNSFRTRRRAGVDGICRLQHLKFSYDFSGAYFDPNQVTLR